ncbi:MAG: 1-acyl-sn-glycerol-3-phosphate acyltransferase [Bacteroidales bacterium]|nr:1-acyl-sn-glycerol-3-phosphate acyltransferase [Bacteroidales bacterium]MDD4669801.1 1-acyl-sn-glycerol-3-phosphate acyltransferase [Bacteroidales bacterium]
MSDNPQLHIDIEAIIANKSPKLAKRVPKFVIKYLKKIEHIDEINEMLSLFGDTQGVEFAENCLKYLNVEYRTHNIEKINRSGRYIIVSNHPLGGFDGMILITVLGKIFPQIKFVVNDLLMNIKPLEPVFVPVNKLGKLSKLYAEQINSTYSSDAQILYFPAGLCSRLIKGNITDLEWKTNFLKKAIEYQRDIIPVFFSGRNSRFFYRLAKLRKLLKIKFNIEMMFLPNELFKQKNRTFDIYFGEPIPINTITKEKTLSEWTEFIRTKAYGANNSTC